MDRARLDTLFRLDGRIAIVTGGTRGIGRAIAEGFVDSGAKVVVCSRRAHSVDETVAALRDRGGEAVGLAANMGDVATGAALVELAVDTFGGLDIVVNNAATALTAPLGEYTEDVFDKVIDVDLKGPVFLVEAALPHLKASPHAVIVNVISAGAFLPGVKTSIYAACKAGLLSYTRTWAWGFAADGIRCNALAPGTVDTDMVRNNGPEAAASMANAAQMRRPAHVDEMIGPAVFLASDASSFLTGQSLTVDGGLVPAR